MQTIYGKIGTGPGDSLCVLRKRKLPQIGDRIMVQRWVERRRDGVHAKKHWLIVDNVTGDLQKTYFLSYV